MRRLALGTLTVVGMVVAVGVTAPPARAACHAFEVAVAPPNPVEGSTVQVTVRRDAAVNPSSVRVRSVDGTAVAGQDYDGVDQRVSFTDEVEQTFTLATRQDGADEPDETFELVLSEGQGCPVNTRFTYGRATVTIIDDDEPPPSSPPPPAPAPSPAPAPAPAPAPPPPPPAAAAPAATATTAATTTTTDEAADAGDEATTDEAVAGTTTTTTRAAGERATTSLATDEAAAPGGDGGSGSGPAVAVAALLAIVGAGAAYTIRRLRRARAG